MRALGAECTQTLLRGASEQGSSDCEGGAHMFNALSLELPPAMLCLHLQELRLCAERVPQLRAHDEDLERRCATRCR